MFLRSTAASLSQSFNIGNGKLEANANKAKFHNGAQKRRRMRFISNCAAAATTIGPEIIGGDLNSDVRTLVPDMESFHLLKGSAV